MHQEVSAGSTSSHVKSTVGEGWVALTEFTPVAALVRDRMTLCIHPSKVWCVAAFKTAFCPFKCQKLTTCDTLLTEQPCATGLLKGILV